MRQQLPERDLVLRFDIDGLAAGVEAGQDVGVAEFVDDGGDVGVEGQEAALDALQRGDAGQEFGAGCDPHGCVGGNGSGLGVGDRQIAERVGVLEFAVAGCSEEDNAGDVLGGTRGFECFLHGWCCRLVKYG